MMDNLRILHILSGRHFVGEAARVCDLIECQNARGHEATLLVGGECEFAQNLDLPRIVRDTEWSRTHTRRTRPLGQLGRARFLRQWFADHDPHIVHVHRGKDHWAVAMARLGRHRPAIVRTRHVVLPLRDHLANRWLFNRATDGWICVSEAVAHSVRASLPWLRHDPLVIEGGIDRSRLEPPTLEAVTGLRARLHLPEDGIVATHLARIDRIKGQLHLVDAIPRIVESVPAAHFVFAYNRWTHYRNEVQARMDALGVYDRVRWVAKMDSVAPLLGLTSVAVVASTGSEGWSRAAVEAAALGVPTVATTVGSLPEIVQDGDTGRLVPPADSGALADAIADLMGSTEDCARMGEAARRASVRWDRERMADETLAVYEAVLKKRGRT